MGLDSQNGLMYSMNKMMKIRMNTGSKIVRRLRDERLVSFTRDQFKVMKKRKLAVPVTLYQL